MSQSNEREVERSRLLSICAFRSTNVQSTSSGTARANARPRSRVGIAGFRSCLPHAIPQLLVGTLIAFVTRLRSRYSWPAPNYLTFRFSLDTVRYESQSVTTRHGSRRGRSNSKPPCGVSGLSRIRTEPRPGLLSRMVRSPSRHIGSPPRHIGATARESHQFSLYLQHCHLEGPLQQDLNVMRFATASDIPDSVT